MLMTDIIKSCQSEYGVYEKQINAMVVDNKNNYGIAGDLLKAIKNRRKETEQHRKELVAPLNDRVKAINGSIKPLTDGLDRLINLLSNKMKSFIEIEARRERELAEIEQKRLIEEARKQAEQVAALFEDDIIFGDVETATEMTERRDDIISNIENRIEKDVEKAGKLDLKVKSFNSTTSVRKSWKFDITDTAQIPREYLVPDLQKIREAVKNGERDIAGVNIFEDISIASR